MSTPPHPTTTYTYMYMYLPLRAMFGNYMYIHSTEVKLTNGHRGCMMSLENNIRNNIPAESFTVTF